LLLLNIFNLQYFFSYRLHLLDVSRTQWSCLSRRTCGVKTAKRGCNSSCTTVLNTSWYVRSIILFRKLLFSWIEYDCFFFNFQETYNSRLRERYEDDPSTHPNFDSDLWMEVGSSSGPDKNQVTGSPTLQPKTCGRPVVSQPLGALHHYRAPSLRSSWSWNNNMNNSRRIMNSSVKCSWTLDQGWVMIHAQSFFGRKFPVTTNLLLLLL
jgi:hypothetical protein